MLTVANGTQRALESGSFTAKVSAGYLSWQWTEDLPALDADQSMDLALHPPEAALMDPRQRGYVSTVDMRVHLNGTHSVMAYLWAPEDGPLELLTERSIHRERDGRKPAHGPMDLPDDQRIVAQPPIYREVVNFEPGPEDTGLPSTVKIPNAVEDGQ